MAKILIAGGTGLVGRKLVGVLLSNNHQVSVLTRNTNQTFPCPLFMWDVNRQQIDEEALQGVDVLINLVGEGVANGRWTSQQKKRILDSRVKSAQLLFDTVQAMNKRPELYLGASAVGYYGVEQVKEPLAEEAPNGRDFLADVCRDWEAAAWQFESLNMSVAIFRIGVVFAKEGGAFSKMTQTLKMGFVNALGSGQQYMPWVHINDVANAFVFAIEKHLKGVYNLVAPESITQSQMMAQITTKKGFRLPNVPSFVMKALLGEMSQILLTGNPIDSSKLQKEGFSFEYSSLRGALDSLLVL